MEHLRRLREAAELTQAQLADLAGTSQPQIRRLESGEREMTPAWARRLSPHLGVSPIEIAFPEVASDRPRLRIFGRVGASPDGEVLSDADADDSDFDTIEAPPGAKGNEAVVEVVGHSMGIYAPDGSLILFETRRDPPTEDMLGAVCVVALTDGRHLVKRLLRGSRKGLFDLESVVGSTMRDQRIVWAGEVTIVLHPRYARRLRRN